MKNNSSTPDEESTAAESAIDDAVLGRTAERYDVDAERLSDALVVLHGSLIGRHSALEREADYATVDDTRAYRVPGSTWDDVLAEFDLDDELAEAVVHAHTEQARLAFEDAVGVDERFAADERGVVVGVDTAEEF